MKKTKKVIILMFALFLFILNTSNITKSGSADILLSNWDDVPSGLDEGTSGYFIFKSTGYADQFETSTGWCLSSPNSFMIRTTGNGNGKGYWNLTQDFSYIGLINFTTKNLNNIGGVAFYIYFYDYLGHNVLKLKFEDYDSSSNFRFVWFSDSGSTIVDVWSEGSVIPIHIQHNTTNSFWVRVYNSDYTIRASMTLSGIYPSNFTNFSYIYFESIGSPLYKYFYIDNFYINTQAGEEETGCNVNMYDKYCNGGYGLYQYFSDYQYVECQLNNLFKGKIYGVDLSVSQEQINQVSNNVNDYFCTIDGIPLGNAKCILPYASGYIIRWIFTEGIELNNEYPLFAFQSKKYVQYASKFYWYGIGIDPYASTSISTKHNSNNYMFNNRIDGLNLEGGEIALCFFTDSNSYTPEKQPLNDTEWWQYNYGHTSYDNIFVEFNKNWINCYYQVGSKVEIAFYLTDDYLENDSRYYSFSIIRTLTGKSVYIGLIGLSENTHNNSGVFTIDYSFEYEGQYIITVYNTSNYGTGQKEFLFGSKPVIVCEKGSAVYPEGYILPKLDKGIGAIVGLIVTLFCLLAPLLVLKGLHANQSLPSIAYVISGCLGIAISVIFGWFETWVIIFIVIISIILLVAQYIIKQRGTGEA